MSMSLLMISCLLGFHDGLASSNYANCLQKQVEVRYASFSNHLAYPLHDAVRTNNLEEVVAILEAGADPNERDEPFSWAPLHYASNRDVDVEIAQALIRHGADVNATGHDGFAPIHRAAADGAAAVVAVLLRAGAEADPADASGRTPLTYAVGQSPSSTLPQRLETARHLLAAGARIERRDERPGPLQLAAMRVDWHVLALLQEFGADLQERDENGNTLLAIAARAGKTSVVNYLAEFIDVDLANKRGQTALVLAVRDAHAADGPVSILLELGADPNVRDGVGMSSLHYAGKRADLASVRLLKDAGADLSARDAANMRPFDYALQTARNHEKQIVRMPGLPEHFRSAEMIAATAIRWGRAAAAHRQVQEALLVALELTDWSENEIARH